MLIPMPKENKGFTLLELAISMTVIGLIIGVIIGGATMIKNAKLQSIMADIDMYTKAASAFKDKYNYLPGDMPTATTFWGTLAGCPTPAYTSTPNTATCNGDGNGHIGDHWLGTNNEELFAAWQQLADAQFISGSYNGMSGTSGAGTYSAMVGFNVPASAYEPGGYTLLYVQPSNFVGDPNYWPANYGHVIAFGAAASGDFTEHAVITPAEARLIDQKMDDALPASGQVMAAQSNLLPNCTTSNTPSLAQYNASAYQGIACALFFITGF